jgi:excisionase family DNA binding protein
VSGSRVSSGLGTPMNGSMRLALSPDEAAAAVGVSRDFFDQHVAPELRIVRRGRRRLVPVRELERWLEESAALTLAVERLPGGRDG